MKINSNFKNINDTYLFSSIGKKVKEFKEKNPSVNVISLGIGDVTLPIPKIITDKMVMASNELNNAKTFRGYGPEQGYDFYKQALKDYYLKNGVNLDLDSIFASDGAKSDLGNILDIFSKDNTVLVPDPVYPVYVDTNIMAGRKIIYAKGSIKNNFLPKPDYFEKADIIYICSPNNPTGAVYSKEGLKEWVDYANSMDAVILFDAAYEAFISGDYPRSIYEIEGAKTCAIEFGSLSKSAGFTGVRCGYTIVPLELIRENTSLNKMWLRRQTTKFNGVSYIVTRGAEMVFKEEGIKACLENINYYKQNAKVMISTMERLGIRYTGGNNSPYLWIEIPNKMNSWEFFDYLLKTANVVGTPGSGFGGAGEGYFRLTAFNSYENTILAMERFEKAMELLLKR